MQGQRACSWLIGSLSGAAICDPRSDFYLKYMSRHFARRIVRWHGGSIIRINPCEPHICDLPGVAIASAALETLGEIDARIS